MAKSAAAVSGVSSPLPSKIKKGGITRWDAAENNSENAEVVNEETEAQKKRRDGQTHRNNQVFFTSSADALQSSPLILQAFFVAICEGKLAAVKSTNVRTKAVVVASLLDNEKNGHLTALFLLFRAGPGAPIMLFSSLLGFPHAHTQRFPRLTLPKNRG